jgi:hypothetical protein
MSRFRPRRPSAALVVSMIALILTLGGTAYANFRLPKNSVGSGQIKNGAVISSKMKNGAVTASKLNVAGVTVPNALHARTADSATNATHATTADSATNATHATNADSATNATTATNASHASAADTASSLGGTPASSYVQFGSTLPAGSTETGVWGTAGNGSTGYELTGIRFYPPLHAPFDGAHVIFTKSTATHCSGPGSADPGYLCIYDESDASVSFNSIGNGTGTTGASTSGAVLFMNVTGATSFAMGSWAVTAP